MDEWQDRPKNQRKNRFGLGGRATPPVENVVEFTDEAEGVWEFKRERSANAVGDFAFSRREQTVGGYRVMGQRGVNAAPKTGRNSYLSNTDSRPNRYNASVRMVAGDAGAMPWEDRRAVESYSKMAIVGEVAAGQYDVTIAYHEPGWGADADFVLVNNDQIKTNRNTFALRVRGQSMIDNEIDDGDVILVQQQDWADDGDFVIACLTDSSDPLGFVTLKRFYRHRHKDRVVLQPANPQLGPIHILPHKGDQTQDDLDGVKIQGRVVAVIKTGGLL